MNPHQGQFKKGQLVPGTSYRVEELIGTGGMGSVYRVEHAELGRRFVLKALHGHLASRQDLVARLKNEWRALGKLEHPNIVQVTDAGQTPDGLPFYVMENLRGTTLGQLMLARKRLGAREACLLVVDILAGLHAAHETGAVHRDIKPPNIFVVEGGRAKLLDFGIAKLRDQSAKVVTAGGISIGTPRYMAPEQASGTVVDGRADIYATALVLYEMVVGKGPFSHIKDPNELVMAHIGLEPERADFVDPRVPNELGDLLQRWLSKSPSSRPANAEFARRELLALAKSLPDEAETGGEEVTVGGGYDASTLGAAALAAHVAPSSVPSPSLSDGPSGSAAKSGPAAKSVLLAKSATSQRKRDATLESAEEGTSEPHPTASLVVDERNDKRAASSDPLEFGRAETLGWGTAAPQAVDERERRLAVGEGGTRRPRDLARRVSVTPPPVSSLRPGGLEQNRTTLKWIGGTAAVSFLLAFGISQWLRGTPTEPAPPEDTGAQTATASPEAPSETSHEKNLRSDTENAGVGAHPERSGAQGAPQTPAPPEVEESTLSAANSEHGRSASASAGLAPSASAPSASAPPASSPRTPVVASNTRPTASGSAPAPAPTPRPGKSSTPRPAPATSKVGDQLPESGLW